MYWLTILCSFREHECIPTQRASSRPTAVHKGSAGLTALVWLYFNTHTHIHKYSQQHREFKKQGRTLRVKETWKAKQCVVLKHSVHTDRMKENPVHPVCGTLRYIVPWYDVAQILPKLVLWLKVALCIVHRDYSVNACVVLSALKDLQYRLDLAWVIVLGSAICSHFQGNVGRGKNEDCHKV